MLIIVMSKMLNGFFLIRRPNHILYLVHCFLYINDPIFNIGAGANQDGRVNIAKSLRRWTVRTKWTMITVSVEWLQYVVVGLHSLHIAECIPTSYLGQIRCQINYFLSGEVRQCLQYLLLARASIGARIAISISIYLPFL